MSLFVAPLHAFHLFTPLEEISADFTRLASPCLGNRTAVYENVVRVSHSFGGHFAGPLRIFGPCVFKLAITLCHWGQALQDLDAALDPCPVEPSRHGLGCLALRRRCFKISLEMGILFISVQRWCTVAFSQIYTNWRGTPRSQQAVRLPHRLDSGISAVA